jgi:hypothetical protein
VVDSDHNQPGFGERPDQLCVEPRDVRPGVVEVARHGIGDSAASRVHDHQPDVVLG